MDKKAEKLKVKIKKGAKGAVTRAAGGRKKDEMIKGRVEMEGEEEKKWLEER